MTTPGSFYAGPRVGRLTLNSWQEVVSAAEAGLLDETSWVELKLDIPPTSKPANLELARDLASLGVDGGLLVVGIADNHGNAGAVEGTSLIGLADRIEQVAASRIAPALPVHTYEVPHPTDEGRGVLVVVGRRRKVLRTWSMSGIGGEVTRASDD
jgi:hypothetical protein